MDDSRLSEQKYTELDYLFQRIEMAKSGQEFKNFRDDTSATLSTTPAMPMAIGTATTAIPMPTAQWELPDELSESGSLGDTAVNPCGWNMATRRLRRHRRFTFSQETTPPAPPSTPTSSNMMTLVAAHHANGGGGSAGADGGSSSGAAAINCSNGTNGTGEYDSQCLNFNLLYILDYAPQYKKKLKEQKRTDSELADLFKVITITGSSTSGSGGGSSNAQQLQSAPARGLKFSLPKRGICAASRNIRKLDSTTKIFKIHRNPKEFIREPDEDSVSAPEYDTEEEDVRHRRLRLKPLRRIVRTGLHYKRPQRLDSSNSKSMVTDCMQAVVDSFDDMSFADF